MGLSGRDGGDRFSGREWPPDLSSTVLIIREEKGSVGKGGARAKTGDSTFYTLYRTGTGTTTPTATHFSLIKENLRGTCITQHSPITSGLVLLLSTATSVGIGKLEKKEK